MAMRSVRHALTGIALLFQASCSGDGIVVVTVVDLSTITFTIEGASQLRVGRDTKLAAVLDTSGNGVGALRILWSSADPGL